MESLGAAAASRAEPSRRALSRLGTVAPGPCLVGLVIRWLSWTVALFAGDFESTFPVGADGAAHIREITTLASAVAVNRSWGPYPAVADVADDIDELSATRFLAMARYEHDSCRTFPKAHGWRYGQERDDQPELHPDLAEWAELNEAAQKKSTEGVRTAIGLLRGLGYRLIDVSSTTNGAQDR